jgi:glc operon protein GlcG
MSRAKTLVAALVAAMALSTLPSVAQDVATHKVLTLAGAQRVIAAALASANGVHAHGAIAVVDDSGNLIAEVTIDGTFPQAALVALGKAHTAAAFRKNTSAFETAVNGGRTALVAMPNFTPLQGGVLITDGSDVVGAIGVSGTASQQQDEDVAKAGAAVLSGVR